MTPTKPRAVLDEAGWTLGCDGVREKDGQKLDLVLGWIYQLRPEPDRARAHPGPAGRRRHRRRRCRPGPAPEYLEGLQERRLRPGLGQPQPGRRRRPAHAVLRRPRTFYGVDDPELEALFTQELATTDAAARNEMLRRRPAPARRARTSRSRCSS